MNVATVDLPAPAIAHFHLAVAGRCAVADDEVVGESVLHSSEMAMVIIERGGVALPRPAVVDDDVLPASARDRSAIDLRFHRCRKITIAAATAAPTATAEQPR